MKKAILLLLFLFSSQLSASHLLGGEITWKCQSNGTYQFTLVLYRDCGGIALDTVAQTIANNTGVIISAAYVSTTDIVPSSYLGTDTCAGATSGSGLMQKYLYRSGDITLTGTPPVGGWNFSWQNCCRPNSIANVPGSTGYFLRAVMYPYTPPGATGPLSAGDTTGPTCYDSSPNFLEDPLVVSCQGTNITYNSYGNDADYDSIYFSFATPMEGGSNPGTGTPVTWGTGYSTSSPMPSGAGSTAANLSSTGELTFNSALTGSYAMCNRVEEFRYGQLIGAIYRDLPVVVINCTPPIGVCSATSGTTKPSLDLVPLNNNSNTTPIANINGDTTSYIINSQVGDTVKFTLYSTDYNINPDCSSQLINFKPSGPDSTQITSLNPGGALSQTGINTIGFTFVIDSADCLVRSGYNDIIPYDYYFTFSDDQAPINRVNIKRVRINVVKLNTVVPCLDTIQQQPISNTFNTIPGDGYFSVSHSDTAASYQWQQNNNGTGWSNLSDNSIFSGTTTDSLVLKGIVPPLNNRAFRCLVNSCNIDTTNIAVLTVVDNIGINEIVKDIIVSPNPTSGLLNIVLTSSAEYEVYNINGQRVAQGKTEGQIDITNLPTGSYQLIINNDDGRSTHTIQKI